MIRLSVQSFFGVLVTVLALVSGTGGEWIGRKCCEYAVDAECRAVCLQSKSKEILELHCMREVEVDLFGCILRHQKRKRCCGKSSNMTTWCQHVCVTSFGRESGPSPDNLRAVERNCPADVLECTKNFSSSVRKSSDEGIICCDRSNSEKCVRGCRRIMRSSLTEREKIDKVVEVCGDPVPREPMWRCLLSRDGEDRRPAPPRVGPDLQCCTKAISSNCRQLCKKLYTRPWESSLNWQYFQQWCEYNSEESDLNTCLQEVREPCKLGCSGLNFCTNFNNRPTQSFHSCNARADNIARVQWREWKRGMIRIPVADIPVLDIETCQPKAWKAVACSLEVKPCGTRLGDSTICRNDCLSLLRECADVSRFERGVTIEWLCEMFSPTHLQHDCIALDKYTTNSEHVSLPGQISQPCNPNPCDDEQICVVNRDECRHGNECPAYKCLSGCKVGDVGDFLLHVRQRVKIQDANRGDGCYRSCACTSTGKLQYCTDLPCMDADKSCTIVGQVKLHRSHFKIDCNFCSCYNGEVTCTKRQCVSGDSSDDNVRDFTGVPCNCDRQFLPVCAPNGHTYPSACLARCMGHDEAEIDFGPCRAKDPCKSKPCRRNERCVRASRVCVTSTSEFGCPQYECVAPYSRCMERRTTRDAYASDGHHYVNHRRLNSASRRSMAPALFPGHNVDWDEADPVCDTNGVEYNNICHLRKKHRQARLAYRGRCKKQCDSKSDPVCGQNVVTYMNECAALAERVLVDYRGACREVSVQEADKEKPSICANAVCKDLSHPECEPIVPPGACCPVCGGMLRVLYSQRHIDGAARSAIHGPITVRDILRSMRRHVYVRECDLFGHLTMEADIAVLSVPVVENPTLLQVESCLSEAERLARFINERHPIFHSDVILSTLTAAEVHGRKGTGNSATSTRLKFHKQAATLGLFKILSHPLQYFRDSKDDFAETKALLQWIAGMSVIHLVVRKFAYSVG